MEKLTAAADGGMAMREQNNGIVALDGSLQRLPILEAWTNSSAVYWAKPSYPATGMVFLVGNAAMDGWAAQLTMTLHPQRGLWRVYVPGEAFTEHCETRYQIVSLDSEGMRHVEGEGILRVYKGAVPSVADTVQNCYATFPGGEVREVTVRNDSTGTPVFSVGGVVEGADADERPIYAFNKATGFYYLVTPFVDDAGEPSLSVADEPSEGGDETFVRDASGFYHRVECAADAAGAMALQTGEAII